MGYKIELSKFFRGRWLTGADLAEDAELASDQLGFSSVLITGGMVTNTGGATQTVGTVPELSIICGIHTYCLATFTTGMGTPTINIGPYSGDTDGYLPTASIGRTISNVSGEACSDRGAILWNSTNKSPIQAFVCASTPVVATCTNLDTTAVTGAGILAVFVQYIPMDASFIADAEEP